MIYKQNGDAVIPPALKDSACTSLERVKLGETDAIKISYGYHEDDLDVVYFTKTEAESLQRWLRDVVPSMQSEPKK